ncbi:serine/threonine phosphatase [cf. Phormidesmis sp. LEGE 11477]|uniref:serine/threonine phosphatase n=1 Tax=cf. Phormidesmis sp. LEGE 11477 TaxID=1828680 RepID=UPI0018826D5D|nr:serine/threonine phosphatase [cf. Phormidesmis sp. LEGE 11477]MBE9063884.1 serine/threonine phosphatase [cf. Phormidesmis sp. LEGE 11477]
MLICANCQFANPTDYNFCQRCGAPLAAKPLLQVKLMPINQLELVPDAYLPAANSPAADLPTTAEPSSQAADSRYQVSTVLNPSKAYVVDNQADVRSPLQQQLAKLTNADTVPTLETLQSILNLPAAAYPYLLLKDAAPPLYDAWEVDETTLIITPEQPTTTPLFKAFSTAIDPLQPVYWTHLLTDLWASLEPIPQWRSSLLQADNLSVTADQSLRVRQFTLPSYQNSYQADQAEDPVHLTDAQFSIPQLSDLQAFLKSLMAQPHRGEVATLRQNRQLILAVTAADTLKQLREELAVIGKALLSTPAATTPQTNPQTSPSLPRSGFKDGFKDTSASHSSTSNPKDDMASVDSSADSSIDPLESILLGDLFEVDESTMVLPMKLVALEDAGRTEVGRMRDHNEDCFSIASSYQKRSNNHTHSLQARCLYVLCDGMGGHDGGEIASQLAAQTLSDYFAEHWPNLLDGDTKADDAKAKAALPTEDMMIAAVKLANQAIYDLNEKEQRAGHERMGTTLVLLLLQGTSAVVAHVGDSRLYQHTRRVGLKQITTDHEVGQREINRGVDPAIAYDRPDAYQLTQALGPRSQENLFPSVTYLDFSEDTLLLLCSDGLSDNNLVEDYLGSHIDPILRGKKGVAAGMDDLMKLANEVNGHDNITGIAVRLKIGPDLAGVRG